MTRLIAFLASLLTFAALWLMASPDRDLSRVGSGLLLALLLAGGVGLALMLGERRG